MGNASRPPPPLLPLPLWGASGCPSTHTGRLSVTSPRKCPPKRTCKRGIHLRVRKLAGQVSGLNGSGAGDIRSLATGRVLGSLSAIFGDPSSPRGKAPVSGNHSPPPPHAHTAALPVTSDLHRARAEGKGWAWWTANANCFHKNSGGHQGPVPLR